LADERHFAKCTKSRFKRIFDNGPFGGQDGFMLEDITKHIRRAIKISDEEINVAIEINFQFYDS